MIYLFSDSWHEARTRLCKLINKQVILMIVIATEPYLSSSRCHVKTSQNEDNIGTRRISL